ncbi:MAG: class II fructose-bisphosphate aldolase [Candidatus Buchananbacteria bacterium]
MLVHINKIVPQARKKKVAIGAFNTSNLEMTLAIARAAVIAKSPIIIQTSESTIKYAGLKTIFAIIKNIAETEAKSIPVAIHLDHGKDLDLIKECIAVGYSSVHCDASEFSFEKNISLTKKVVGFAHKRGSWVQGELGGFAGKEGMSASGLPKNLDSFFTDPSKVKEYIVKTGIDTLAVSVGTIHGSFKGKEKIHFHLLEQINKLAKIPLVLHGASGTDPEEIKQAIKLGATIINIDTDVRVAFTKALQQTLSSKIIFYDPRKILAPATEAASQEVINKIKLFRSSLVK